MSKVGIQYLKGAENAKFKDRTGEKHTNRQGCEIEIIEYFNSNNCTIKFIQYENIVYNVIYNNVKKGAVKNCYFPFVYGIGYSGSGVYRCSVNGKVTKEYVYWNSMIERGYSIIYKNKFPAYKEVTVYKEWHNFQVFGDWFKENHIKEFALDKDILLKGNKIYSPETCCFVPQEINNLFIKRLRGRGKYPIGVSLNKGKYFSEISCGNTRISLGYFDTPQEAFQAYKTAKEAYIKEVADKWRGQITEQVYEAMYNYKVEIDD